MMDAKGRAVPMLVCYWGRWADASGGVGPFSRTCVTRVEGDAGTLHYALPGAAAKCEQIRVTQVRGQLEGRGMVRINENRPPLEIASEDDALFSAIDQLKVATVHLLDAA